MFLRRLHRPLVGALAAIGLVACSAAADSGEEGPTGTGVAAQEVGTVDDGTTDPTLSGVGVLPGPLPTDAIDEIASTTTMAEVEEAETIGAQAGGNRVIMLGDSILASTSKRYGNQMCAALVPLGWQVEIDAEVSRPVAFGQQVMADRWDEGWDAGLVFLGNNYGGDEQDFFKRYTALLDAFEGKPVVVVSVTEFEAQQTEVNDIIEALAETFDNVTLIDWKTISTYEGVRGDDGLHLTDLGRQVLADAVAPVFGVAPAQPGDCLDTKYHDDSAGSVDGTGTSGSGSGSGSNTRPTTATTTKPSTSTTAGGGQTSTTTGSTTGSTTATTKPPTGSTTATTSPPQTTPPQTSPPQTNPPQTSPPQTSPPVTPEPP